LENLNDPFCFIDLKVKNGFLTTSSCWLVWFVVKIFKILLFGDKLLMNAISHEADIIGEMIPRI